MDNISAGCITIGKLVAAKDRTSNEPTYNFWVPKYQRGYRWTEHEATLLLDDIYKFKTNDNKKYCLQPLIFKKIEGGQNDGKYEVIDGQQRLTTIYLFIKVASQEFGVINSIYGLSYETRSNSEKFLENISEKECNKYKEENIDFHHMSEVYNGMKEWIKQKCDPGSEQRFATNILNKLCDNVFFIMYELSSEANSIEYFRKVNLGKIELTDAELIKALLLKSDNFTDKLENSKEVEKKQNEIAVSWDRIEHGLQEEAFWGFVGQPSKQGARIELLFRIITPVTDNNKHSIFEYYAKKFEEAKTIAEKNKLVYDTWQEVEKTYDSIRDWYHDHFKYHLVGYLTTISGESSSIVKTVYDETKGCRKSEVINKLKELIKKHSDYDPQKINNYYYGTDSDKIRKVLLLFNIATAVCNSNKEYRFPFYLYKKTKHDIEHINAINNDNTDEDHSIGNLTLLQDSTNRSYKDKDFKDKRAIILKEEKNGLFLPICTRNVFVKAYTQLSKDQDTIDFEIWTDDDKADYVREMVDTIDKFFSFDPNNEDRKVKKDDNR